MIHQNLRLATLLLLLTISLAQGPPNNTSPNNGTNSTESKV